MVVTLMLAGTLKGFDMNVTKKLLLCSLGLALSGALSSVQAEEKTLRLYNWADYFAEDTLSRFTAETGIKVIYDVMDGSETLEAKLMAGGSGYDLIFPGDTVGERLMHAVRQLDEHNTTGRLRRDFENEAPSMARLVEAIQEQLVPALKRAGYQV